MLDRASQSAIETNVTHGLRGVCDCVNAAAPAWATVRLRPESQAAFWGEKPWNVEKEVIQRGDYTGKHGA